MIYILSVVIEEYDAVLQDFAKVKLFSKGVPLAPYTQWADCFWECMIAGRYQ